MKINLIFTVRSPILEKILVAFSFHSQLCSIFYFQRVMLLNIYLWWWHIEWSCCTKYILAFHPGFFTCTANNFGLMCCRKRISQNSFPNFIYIIPKSFMIFCQEPNHTLRPQDALALYKSFNILCIPSSWERRKNPCLGINIFTLGKHSPTSVCSNS